MFRAFDPDSDRLVAVKVFATDLAPERVHQVVAAFERLLGSALKHRAIASPIATGIHDNHPYLVQEYVSADSLDVVVRHGPASPDDAVRIAAELAGALDFAAVDGILHGALNPRDVLLTPDETRLTGLGIARAFELVDVPAPIRRPYTPPEGIAGRSWDRRADVFSLAAVVHELMWGRRLSAMGQQASDSLTPLEGADLDALRAVFARALAEEPADRFETAMEFAEGLKQAFPRVVLAKRRSPRAVPTPKLVELREVEPRLPLESDLFREERESPTPVEIVLQGQDDLPIRAVEPDADQVRLPSSPPDGFVEIGEPDAPAAAYVEVVAEPVETSSAEALPAAVPVGLFDSQAVPVDVTPLSSRSEIWPLALALIVGAAIGFGGGYFFAHFERTAEPAAVTAVDPPAPAGREFTENTVADAPTAPATEAQATAAPPAVARPPAAPEPAASRETTTPPPATAKPQTAKPAPRAASPPAAAAAKAGRLLVRSTPTGARVFVDGREAGTTPLTVDELARGVHRVRVVREGYATAERRITITAGRPSQTMTVPLARAKTAQTKAPAAAPAVGPGRMTVISRPAGAQVFVNDKPVGTTPLQVPGIAAGTHRVRIELAGYRPWISTVDVAAAEQKRVTASLDR